MKASLMIFLLALSSLAHAKSVFFCASALEGPVGPSTMKLETDGSQYKLIYRENLSSTPQVLADNLDCVFSTDMKMPYVTYCHSDNIFVNVRQSTEAQLYGESGVLKFDFVTFTILQGLEKFDFKTRIDMCEIVSL